MFVLSFLYGPAHPMYIPLLPAAFSYKMKKHIAFQQCAFKISYSKLFYLYRYIKIFPCKRNVIFINRVK